MITSKKRKDLGFSEIELVTFIVLVTVIVIVTRAGIDYAHESKIKSDIANITAYKSAIHQFKDKYGELPGDFRHAKTVWPDCVDNEMLKTTCNGDGDGMWNDNEGLYVFEHLSRAEFIDDQYRMVTDKGWASLYPTVQTTGQNIVPIGRLGSTSQQNISTVFYDYPLPTNSFLFYFESDTPGGIVPTQKKIEPLVVRTIDEKLDDGNGATGNIRAAFDRREVFGAYPLGDLCTDVNGKYKLDEDNLYYCSFIIKY
jgi:hypothetical protein